MRRVLALLVPATLLLTGCSSPARDSSTVLTVFAAASLAKPFTEIADAYRAEHEGVEVRLNFAGSADLVAQLAAGAPADVLATADAQTMDRAVSQYLVDGGVSAFASNTMEIAVPPDNPAGITDLAGALAPGWALVVCAPQVPCGGAAHAVAANAGLALRPVSEETSVAGVMGKVSSGEADAGIVYVTDVAGAGGSVLGVPIPAEVNVRNTYAIAAVARQPQSAESAAFIGFVLGPQAQQILRGAGFGAP
jgi:molybdate transport system substrate-binding protein